MFKEFKEFAMKGNVIDLAVGIIIGGAFGKIVSSLVNDIIMPVFGVILGRVDLTKVRHIIRESSEGVDELSIKYGQFLQNILDFLIISFSIFLFVRILNRLRNKKEVAPPPKAPPAPSKEENLLTEIRDILKKGSK